MKKLAGGIAFLSIMLIGALPVAAEDLDSLLKNVKSYSEKESYTKALEELSWAQKEIQKMHMKKLETFFPDTLGEYSGQKFETKSAMGFTSLERVYVNGGNKIRLSMAGGSGGANNPMAALGGMGKMAAMFGGNQPGTDSFRINGRTAMLKTNGSRPELTLFLDEGSIITMKVIGGKPEAESLKKLPEDINIDALDNYLGAKG